MVEFHTFRSRPNRLWQMMLVSAAAAFFLSVAAMDFSLQTGLAGELLGWLPAFGALLLGGALVAGRLNQRAPAWVRRLLLGSLAIALVQAALLALRFSQGAGPWAAASYLSAALVIQGFTLTAAISARQRPAAELSYATPFARLVLLVLGLSFLTLASGAFVSVSGAAAACRSWPLCGGLVAPESQFEWIQLLHRASVGLGGVMTLWMFFAGWRSQRNRVRSLVLTTAAAILFLAQGLIGAMIAGGGVDPVLVGLHAVSGPAVWVVVVLLALQVGLSGGQDQVVQSMELVEDGRRQRLRDFITLTKPVIVLLLLVTTLGGMIVGGRAWPDLPVVLWTMLGGALAAGGSGAINQYIDRDVDARMKRTARRPLAAGRLEPAEGLAFGVGLCLLSFYLLALFVNLLAALLSVAGMVYYVWLYSIVLKKASVQNIVIGGGAGAIPPLVGWAAVTGSLTIPSALLFVIIFFWTPPHFWALALIRSKDYARGGIPMLPVVRGEMETRRQILVYTLVLVAITLLAWPVGLAGWIYTAGAALLGFWLIGIAYRLWREYSPKLAWKMYRQSSMYLLYLFMLLAVDALVG